MSNYYTPLIPDCMYHIMSHAVGNEKLFLEHNNYEFFLKKYKKYIPPIADTFAFCLLPDHFHFLIQVKPVIQVEEFLMAKKGVTSINPDKISDLIMECFSNLLNSYTKSFNHVCCRRGGLFIDYLRRVEVPDTSQFGSTICYIHKDPIHHCYCNSIDSWHWSSYNTLTDASETILKREKVLDWFGGVSAFKQFHDQPIDFRKAVIVE